ncbi:hypothetical protein SAY86_020282 [Trapa natans]|uniref:Uncharacterized protein n=1 Tax=Trapa natans TaxID=22666 RepID=A0AAN7LZ85_TRANT|nr:hypothetical protein SAY86_020282 [Trapa natans]
MLGMEQWRRVNTRVPTSALFLCGSPIFLRGSIHWLGYRSVISVVILAFDVHEEVFLEMEVPSAIVQASGYSLHAHGESLCLLDNRCSRLRCGSLLGYEAVWREAIVV